VINPTTYEVTDEQGVMQKVYNQSAMKQYLPPMGKDT
jgi:hypothetical protein